MNGTRAHYIVTTYATTFFDWLFKGGSKDLLQTASPAFPEVVYDDGTAVAGNGSSATTSAVAVASETASSGAQRVWGDGLWVGGVVGGALMVCLGLM